MKKIIVLTGSPRKNGNTEILADSFIKGAREARNQVEKVCLAGKKINGCLGCDYCMRNDGTCVQKDDMQEIYQKLYAADMVVLASPLYYFGLSAQLKAVIDRFYAAIAKPFPIKSTALLIAQGAQGTGDTAPAIDQYRIIARELGWEDLGTVIARDVMQKGDIAGNPALDEAEKLGLHIK